MSVRWRNMVERREGRSPAGARRSSQWRGVRDAFLAGKVCAVCGGQRCLVAHHVIPFHIAPDLELDPENLLPLCEAERYGLNCHQFIGHLGNWSEMNVNVLADAAYWQMRLLQCRNG